MARVAPMGLNSSRCDFSSNWWKKAPFPFMHSVVAEKKQQCACAFECVLPPQTSPLMSSHWRSSHSQFLPWMRLSPGGWQVHCPHRHWPKKIKETKSKKMSSSDNRAFSAAFDRQDAPPRSFLSYLQTCSDWLLNVFRPATVPAASWAGEAVGGADLAGEWPDAGAGKRTQFHLKMPRTCFSQPPPLPPPRGIVSLHSWSSLWKHNVRWPLTPRWSASLLTDPLTRRLEAAWIHRVSDNWQAVFLCGMNIYPDSSLASFPPHSELIPGLRVLIMVTHGNQVALE